jgi:TetR/AcrR family transcriptional regulator
MARTRAATYDDQRALILARAAELFARRGYTAASMNEVAAACAVSKATLYHYVRDKHALLAQIAGDHVARLEALVAAVKAERLAPAAELDALIRRFTAAYADAQHEHRVLTEDVRFLHDAERAQVEGGQRRVVTAFAAAIARVRPDLAPLATPLAMLLFGMINWTFTWMKPRGTLTHDTLAPIVAELFFGGLPAVSPPPVAARKRRARASVAESA